MLGKSVVADDKVNDSTEVRDELPIDNDQPDNMEVSAAAAAEILSKKERQLEERKKEGTGRETESLSSSTLQDLSQFETARTHQHIYPSLPLPMDTQLSFLTPSSQPSAPPPPPPMQFEDDTMAKSSNEPISGRDSPRITTLLALRSTRAGAKKPDGTPPPPSSASPSSMAASSSSSRSASSILESLQLAKKQGGGGDMTPALGEKKVPANNKMSPSKSGSSSKRKPSPRNVRHAVVPSGGSVGISSVNGNGSKPVRNGTKTSSPESDFETAPEGVREGDSNDHEQTSEGEGESGKKSEVIIRTNTYTHLGTKRKSTGAFGSTSMDSSTSSESWQTAAQVSKGGNNGAGSISSPPPPPPSADAEEGPTPTKRLRSLATPSVPSLRRALGGSKVTTPQQQSSRNSSSSDVKKSRGSPKTTTKNGSSQNSSGHSRSLSIGSGLAAILSRPVAGKLLMMKSPTSSSSSVAAASGAGQKQQGDPVVKKEPTSSHSWIAQLFHKS